MAEIIPNHTYNLFDEAIELFYYGIPHDWSLKKLQSSSDIPECSLLARKVVSAMRNANVTTLYAPRADFSARFCDRKDFMMPILLEFGKTLWRGCSGDAVEIRRHEATCISSGDCPTVIIWSNISERLLVAHAGRDCLVDKEKIIHGPIGMSRLPESVIDTMIDTFDPKEIPTLQVAVVLGISAEYFAHDTRTGPAREYNKKMVRYIMEHWGRESIFGNPDDGKIDLKEIIRKQCTCRGIRVENILTDGIDTFSHRNKKDQFYWWSNRRGNLERNLVVVARH